MRIRVVVQQEIGHYTVHSAVVDKNQDTGLPLIEGGSITGAQALAGLEVMETYCAWFDTITLPDRGIVGYVGAFPDVDSYKDKFLKTLMEGRL